MKIHHLNIPNPPILNPTQAGGASNNADDLAALSSFGGDSGYSPSPQLQNLLQQSQQQPDVRPEVVSAAIQRYQQGFYMTPASAEQTATSIMSGLPNS